MIQRDILLKTALNVYLKQIENLPDSPVKRSTIKQIKHEIELIEQGK
ncbi:hypothetical protein T190115A13A_60193 [Tenacibaculum sp. 190524A02b]|uniref:Uncharacterized protein n=1 Tax=Tenacibaculum vairaonense TaxID=3137860 RepID=A0ABP1FHX1_9FLAO